ncbi:MAG: formate dehydrogenase subunit delta [Natronospirillum sp.]|uniref:formate dehydrogenase subunit delta n=1 Tax=Natronospirillum sp. TaxID=2812955 RepID=UPI0025F3A95D|nr:formate dehydrogenase subunit delta [Natronospirillum sp.]MCH8533122.1 formate dehydrogenase subunit delta [Saccharospirillum sp.]MCH8553316.1 formate dehydrogenase subunit delta [Natronospirillum sp.]
MSYQNDPQLQSLIRMANQISVNLARDDDEQSATLIANHLKKFWAKSMKEQFIAYAQEDGQDLSALARMAAERLSEIKA